MAFEARLERRSPPYIFIGCHEEQIFSFPPCSRCELNIGFSQCWSTFKPGQALAIPMPPIFDHNFFATRSDSKVIKDLWSLAISEMCALLFTLSESEPVWVPRLDLPRDQRLRIYTICTFGVLHRLPPKGTEFHDHEAIPHVSKHNGILFVEGNLAAMPTLQLDSSVVRGCQWVPCFEVDGTILAIGGHEYIQM